MATIQRLWSTKRRFRILAAIFGVALIYLLPFLAMPGFAAIYLKLEGIDGESTSLAFPKMIQVDSVQWGSGRGISMPKAGGDREVSAASVSEINLSKPMDKASLPIFREAVAGQTGKAATIYFTSTAGGGQETAYYEITLSDVLVSSFSQGSGGDRPSESLSLNFTKIALKYTPQGAEGKSGTAINASYDLTTGKAQ
ncbi:MAG: type VI secretion system tube protein Hcp [Verrucomicrobia bacterium]|nr:type VI secretion system tube protein Hcp [Verrucomicrobiota bacterium]